MTEKRSLPNLFSAGVLNWKKQSMQDKEKPTDVLQNNLLYQIWMIKTSKITTRKTKVEYKSN